MTGIFEGEGSPLTRELYTSWYTALKLCAVDAWGIFEGVGPGGLLMELSTPFEMVGSGSAAVSTCATTRDGAAASGDNTGNPFFARDTIGCCNFEGLFSGLNKTGFIETSAEASREGILEADSDTLRFTGDLVGDLLTSTIALATGFETCKEMEVGLDSDGNPRLASG